jgi:hypothetical protein
MTLNHVMYQHGFYAVKPSLLFTASTITLLKYKKKCINVLRAGKSLKRNKTKEDVDGTAVKESFTTFYLATIKLLS